MHLSFAELTAHVAGTRYKPLAITTWNRHVSGNERVLESGRVSNELVVGGKNPFDGALDRRGGRPLGVMAGGSEDRSMWSDEQLTCPFQLTTVLRAAGCPFRRQKPGSLMIRDPLYWVVLIAAFSGMRAGRRFVSSTSGILSQMQRQGIVYFNLKAPGLELKNRRYSRRWVPVDRTLIELGFLSERVEGRHADEHVFSELEGKDNFGDKIGKQFSRYRQNAKMYERLLDLHSFRHTVFYLAHPSWRPTSACGRNHRTSL